MPVSKRSNNKILSRLRPADFAAVSPKLEKVSLTFGEYLHQAGEPIKHLYFPEAGMISLISKADDASFIEVGMLGNEGVAGFSVALGVRKSGNVAVVQGAGNAQRMLARDFFALSKSVPTLQREVLRSVHGLLTQTALTAACNAYHPADRRLARWLLMSHDRMKADAFQITQGFLSHMLGVRREAVNKAIGQLRDKGLIAFSRARVVIQDRAELQNLSCSCYGKILAAYEESQ